MAEVAHKMEQKSGRIEYIDVFRYLTVSFAIISHVILQYDIYGSSEFYGSEFLKSITMTATPSLLILFGMMAELVYARKFREDKLQTVSSLLYRAFLCYLAFIALAVLDFIFVERSVGRLVGAVTLIAPIEFANIFKIYAILLVLTPIILVIRDRFGSLGLLSFVAATLAFHHFVISGLPLLPRPFHHIGGLLLGIGGEWGPSILHASMLMVVGMFLASALSARPALAGSRLVMVALAVVSVVLLATSISSQGLIQTATNIADSSIWRDKNHVGYYAYGLVATLLILAISYLASRILTDSIKAPAKIIGGATLVYFFLANALLKILPAFDSREAWISAGLILGYLIVSGAATIAWSKYGRNNGTIRGINTGGPDLIRRFLEKVSGRSAISRAAD